MMNKHIRISGNPASEIYLQVISKLDKKITTTRGYWNIIVNIKHPTIKGKEKEVQATLQNPDFIRQNLTNKKVYLFYKKRGSTYLCVVVRHLNGQGFIITVYITNKMKEGKQIWQKNTQK